MRDDLTNLNPEQQLAAHADGELDSETSRRIDERLSQDPAAARRVEAHRQLRTSVARVMSGPTYRAPAELYAAIADLARSVQDESDAPVAEPTAPQADAGPPVLARIGRWLPAAVAAVLLIGALVIFNNNRNQPPGTPWMQSANVLNASLVKRFADRHIQCSYDEDNLEGTTRFPQNLTQLPGALSDYLHTTIDPKTLDLSALGYHFDAVGLCILPGEGSVHMIYQTQATDPNTEPKSLSLWLRPYMLDGSNGPSDMPTLEEDKLYASPATDTAHPMLVWRHGKMAYYLLGDDYATVEEAFHAIQQAPK